MNSGKLFSKAGLLILAIATLAIVGLLNTGLKGARVDLTEDQLYTVSSGTIDMLRDIENPVTLELFFSDKQTSDIPQLRDFARRVRELLEEMSIKSDGKVSLKLIDPEPFSEEEDRAAELGLQSTPISMGGPEIYLGLAASNDNGGSEVIEFLQPDREQYLEYEVAKMLHIVGRDKAPKVALLAGLQVQGGFDMQTRQPTPAWMATNQLQQMFDVSTVQNGVNSIENDVDVLLLIHPPALDANTQYAIDQFVLRGGNLIAFVDPYAEQAAGPNPMAPSPGAANKSSNMAVLFKQWGLQLAEGKIVGDLQHALEVGSPGGGRPVRHLGILGYPAATFASDDIVTRELNLLHFATAGALQPLSETTTTFSPLLLSSAQSMLLDTSKFESMFDPNSLFEGFQPDGNRHVLAARITGPVASAFPEGAPPTPPSPESTEDDSAAQDIAPQKTATASDESGEETEHIGRSAEDINVLIVADTDFLSNRLWVQVQNFFGQQIGSAFADNGNFLVNAVDNMIGNADLISTRSRGQYVRRFERVDELRLQAEQSYRTTEQRLQQSLAETEQKLSELQASKDAGDTTDALNLSISPEQVAELEKFQQEKLSIRKQLREVQHRLGRDIEALGARIKMLNIGLVPLLLTILALMFRFMRRSN
ncbi:MAG: GldG family protein [Pseudomonadales bacterium]